MSKIKQLYFFFSIISIGLLISCEASYGEKFTKGNLEIYYTDDCAAYVEPVANYFECNNLIQDQPHSIQLTSSSLGSEDPGFILKMIVSEKDKTIPEDQKYNIDVLERDLKKKVYNNSNFRIEICNENFVEINT